MRGRSQVLYMPPPPPRVLDVSPPTRQVLTLVDLSPFLHRTYYVPHAVIIITLSPEVEQARSSNNRAGRPSNRGGVHRN